MKKGVISFPVLLEVFILMLIWAVALFFATSCKTSSKTEKSETKDNVIIKTVEKVMKVPVTVYVEVPEEEKERICNDSTSHLETSFAVSDAAMIWIDGVPFLRHNLRNKPQIITKHDTVCVTAKDSTATSKSQKTYIKNKYVKIELTFWDKIWYYITGGLIGLVIGVIFTCVIKKSVKC